MRHIFLYLCLFLWGCNSTSCAKERESLKIGVFSDPHYLSEQLMDGGQAIQKYDIAGGKVISQVPLVLDQVLNDYLNSDIEVLLISGDMSKDGEKQSHINFAEKLKPLIEKGVRVFVIPGNHDINMPNASGYRGENTYKVDNTSPQDFADIYADCGYKEAIKRDAASLSYVAELSASTWLLAIDSNKYNEYTPHTYTSGGKIGSETEKWIADVMKEAKQKDIEVIGMMHHGLVEHIMMQATFFGDYIIDDWQRLAPLFANGGMKAIFTGHFHANDITEYRSREGNKIYDIETGSLAVYPFPYRFAELNKDRLKISTKNINSTSASPQLSEDNKAVMQERAKRLAIQKISQRGISLSPKATSIVADIVAKVFVMHLAGDEKIDDELKEWIGQLSAELGSTTDIPAELMGLDTYPADNNVEIKF